MRTFAHHLIACRLNRRAEIERENARAAQIKQSLAPVFYFIWAAIFIAFVILLIRDDQEHADQINAHTNCQQYTRATEK